MNEIEVGYFALVNELDYDNSSGIVITVNNW